MIFRVSRHFSKEIEKLLLGDESTHVVDPIHGLERLALIGIDKAICSAMQLRMAENQIESITFLTKPEGAVYPIEELPKDQQQLPGFYWRGDEMIRSKSDLTKDRAKTDFDSQSADAKEIMSRLKR